MRTIPGMHKFIKPVDDVIRLEPLPITLPLVIIMISQGNTLPNKTEVNEIKRKIINEQEVRISQQALKVGQEKTPHTLKAIQDPKIPGRSSWLGVLPLAELGFRPK